MALKITKASDPLAVNRLSIVLYAAPGLGKTSVAFTADAPLLLDFDNGSHRAVNRKDSVRVSDWSDVAGITADDLAPFKTVIMDTAGRALDALTVDIIRANPKHGRGGARTCWRLSGRQMAATGGRFGGDRFFAGELVQDLHRFDMIAGLRWRLE